MLINFIKKNKHVLVNIGEAPELKASLARSNARLYDNEWSA